MTFGEFQDQELDCEECPIRKAEFCPHAIGFDYDPPCSFADPDQDMDDWIKDKIERNRRIEEWQDKQIRKEKEKKEIARKRAETAQRMKSYCRNERAEIAEIKKAIKALEKTIQTAKCWAFAINRTNEMFLQAQGGEEYKARKQVNPELTAQLDNLKEQLKVAEEKYKAKRKEFYANRR